MKTLFEHIEHVKTKPHHIRKRVAFFAAGSLTAVIALVWLTGSIALGRFALPSNSFADAGGEPSIIATGNESTQGNSFAGVAAAFEDPAPAKIQIVNVSTSTTVGKPLEETVIPF